MKKFSIVSGSTTKAFCSGIVLNLMLVGFVTSSFGMLLGGHERFLTLFVAAVFVLMGIHLTGLVHLKFFSFFSFRGADSSEQRGLWGALVLGVVSGLAIGPCSIAWRANTTNSPSTGPMEASS